jgi:N-acetylglucosaminyl-diphospho-decaprenol L-rhamnosyltransferase
MDLSIIYVNWNSIDYIHESIDSVYQNTSGVEFEIIVVDNASPEGNVDLLRAAFPEIIIVKSATNLGFARANNLGFQYSKGDYILFLNPDTKLVSPAINTMLDRAKNIPDAGIVGCRLLNSDLSVQITSIQKFPTILNQMFDFEYLQMRWPGCSLWSIAPLFDPAVKTLKVEVISGACMLMARSTFERADKFTEEYFMYAEDIDLNHKVRHAGFANYYIGDATIVHYGGKSSGQQSVSHWSTMMRYRAMGKLFNNTKGKVQGLLYRVAMGSAAVGRLVLLTCVYLLGGLLGDRAALRYAIGKWKVVLRWALGHQDMRFGNR